MKGWQTVSCSVAEEKDIILLEPANLLLCFFIAHYLFQFGVLKGKLGSIVSVFLLCGNWYWAVVVLVQHLPTECKEPKAKSGKQLPETLTEIKNTFSLTPSLSSHTQTPIGGHSYSWSFLNNLPYFTTPTLAGTLEFGRSNVPWRGREPESAPSPTIQHNIPVASLVCVCVCL